MRKNIYIIAAAMTIITVLTGCSHSTDSIPKETQTETESDTGIAVDNIDNGESGYTYRFTECNGVNFFCQKDDAFYVTNNNAIECYRLESEDTIAKQPLNSVSYKVQGQDTETTAYYYVGDDGVHAVGINENKADVTYTIPGNDHEFIAVNAVGYLLYAYRINIETGTAQYLFDSLDSIKIKANKVIVSPDGMQMLIKADMSNGSEIDRSTRTDLDCEYYYLDLNTNKLTSLTDLTGVETNRYEQSDKIVSEYGFTDNQSIFLIVHNRVDNSQMAVYYRIGQTAQTFNINETSDLTLIGTGSDYSLLALGGQQLYAIHNADGAMTSLDMSGNLQSDVKTRTDRILINNEAVFDCITGELQMLDTNNVDSVFSFYGEDGILEYGVKAGCTEYSVR